MCGWGVLFRKGRNQLLFCWWLLVLSWRLLRRCSSSMSDGCTAADLLDNGIDEKDLHWEPDWGQLVTQKNRQLEVSRKSLFLFRQRRMTKHCVYQWIWHENLQNRVRFPIRTVVLDHADMENCHCRVCKASSNCGLPCKSLATADPTVGDPGLPFSSITSQESKATKTRKKLRQQLQWCSSVKQAKLSFWGDLTYTNRTSCKFMHYLGKARHGYIISIYWKCRYPAQCTPQIINSRSISCCKPAHCECSVWMKYTRIGFLILYIILHQTSCQATSAF